MYIINFKNIKQRDLVLNILVVFLLLFVSLILQALLIENPYLRGEIGNILVDSLSPIIGRAGLYFFILVGFIISILVLFENSDFDLEDLKRFKNKIKLRNSLDIKKIENKRREKRAEEINQTIYKNVEKKLDKNISEIKIIESNAKKIVPQVLEKEEEIIEEEFVESSLFDEKNAERTVGESHNLIVEELEENKKLLDQIELGKTEKPKNFKLPPSSFFQDSPKDNKSKVSEAFIDQKIADLLDKLAMFKI